MTPALLVGARVALVDFHTACTWDVSDAFRIFMKNVPNDAPSSRAALLLKPERPTIVNYSILVVLFSIRVLFRTQCAIESDDVGASLLRVLVTYYFEIAALNSDGHAHMRCKYRCRCELASGVGG